MINKRIKKKTYISNMKSTSTENIISWQASDFIYYKKSTNWYIIISVVGVILIALFYYYRLYAGIAVIAAALLAMFSLAKTKPTVIKYMLSDKGIAFKNKTYNFENLKSFYVYVEPGTRLVRLFMEQTGKLKPDLIIILGRINPQIVRNFLMRKLPENPALKQQTRDTVSRLIGF